MSDVVRRIGLSLGADLCWPQCYEDLMRELDLAIPVGRNTVRFEVRRVTIEPFDLRKPSPHDLVIDRLTHWYHTSREWIKKAVLLDGLYVFNNPWSVQSMEKQTTYCAMMRLGMPIPRTWLVPPKEYEAKPDLQPTLERYAELFDLGRVGSELGYPLFMKPYDGGGWVGVNKIDDEAGLRDAYERSGRFVMHLQEGIEPHDAFVRCVGVGPQVLLVRYDPAAALHERYRPDVDVVAPSEARHLEDVTLTINAFFGWDFNSCESLRREGTWHPIDFANPCPDSQVTSLHFHFPWLVKAILRWSVFCAATRRRMRIQPDWNPFFRIAARRGLSPQERLQGYVALARKRFDADRFAEFCDAHLGHLDEVARRYFGTDRARDAIAQKVQALFPEHEWEAFTEHFWQKIQEWRAYDATRSAPTSGSESGGAELRS